MLDLGPSTYLRLGFALATVTVIGLGDPLTLLSKPSTKWRRPPKSSRRSPAHYRPPSLKPAPPMT